MLAGYFMAMLTAFGFSKPERRRKDNRPKVTQIEHRELQTWI
ncbi:hypothetical protein V1280_008842 [Bradyrhizobium sp. AZCC 2230]